MKLKNHRTLLLIIGIISIVVMIGLTSGCGSAYAPEQNNLSLEIPETTLPLPESAHSISVSPTLQPELAPYIPDYPLLGTTWRVVGMIDMDGSIITMEDLIRTVGQPVFEFMENNIINVGVFNFDSGFSRLDYSLQYSYEIRGNELTIVLTDYLTVVAIINENRFSYTTDTGTIVFEKVDDLSSLQVEEVLTEPEGEVIVQFIGKTNIYQDVRAGRFSNRVEFEILVQNNTDRNIRGIQGFVEIQNLFGVDIMGLNADLIGQTIYAGQSAVFERIGFDINQFMNNHVRVFTTDFDDLIFVYTITQIVFAD